MNQRLRLVVADDEPPIRGLVALWLGRSGYLLGSGSKNKPGAGLVALWLGRSGYSVTTVANGLELVAACQREHPDLVVSDVQMPGQNGLAAAAILRTELALSIVLMSGTWTAEQVAQAARLGVIRLNKPLNLLALLTALRVCAGWRRAASGEWVARMSDSSTR